MGSYDNGISTRKAIVAACKQLFCEKGYAETSYGDIVRAAHVNRSSIYYHFKDKEAIRYEVVWEYLTAFRRLIRQYCSQEEHSLTLAMYCFWVRTIHDAKFRKFINDYQSDFPVYVPDAGMPQFYRVAYNGMHGHIWNLEDISPVAFASVYGYIIGVIQMMNANPSAYDARQLFRMCLNWGMAIWGIPSEKIHARWAELESFIDSIPIREIETLPLY